MFPPEFQDAKTNQGYKFKCKVKLIKKDFTIWSGRQIDDDLVILIPEQSTKMTAFLDAWLPTKLTDDEIARGLKEEKPEVLIHVLEPFFMRGRVSVHHKDEFSLDSPYLFLMSFEVEEELKKRLKDNPNLKVLIKSLPESVEAEEVMSST